MVSTEDVLVSIDASYFDSKTLLIDAAEVYESKTVNLKITATLDDYPLVFKDYEMEIILYEVKVD